MLQAFDEIAEKIANEVLGDTSEKNNNGLLLEAYLQILRSKVLKEIERKKQKTLMGVGVENEQEN